jgi:hypothetical protein
MRDLAGLKISEPRALALRYSVRHRNVNYCLHGRDMSLIKTNRFVQKSCALGKSACWVQRPLKLEIMDISPRLDSCAGYALSRAMTAADAIRARPMLVHAIDEDGVGF